MIGDIVSFYDKEEGVQCLGIVSALSLSRNVCVTTRNGIESHRVLASELTAVPLSPEILEANCFERFEQGGDRVDMWRGFGKDNEDDLEISFRKDLIRVKIDANGIYLETCIITYVHELQHILREYGIEDEIKIKLWQE